MKVAEQKNRELADVKSALFWSGRRKPTTYQRRVDVIKQLHGRSDGSGQPYGYARGDRSITRKQIWLNKMDDTGTIGQHGREWR